MNLQAVILAAGKGSRLMPFTERCSKGMAPIVGKPIARRVIEQFLESGIHDYILVIHPQDEQIRPYFSAYAEEHGLRFTFVEQQEQKGMAHALLQATPFIKSDFFLSACDNLVRHTLVPQMIEALTPGVSSVLLLKPVSLDQVSSTGIIEFEGEKIIRIHEKPAPAEATSTISSLPMYLIRQEVCQYLPMVQPSGRGEYELQDALELMLPLGDMRGVYTDWRLTLTNIADLLAINLHILREEQTAWCTKSARVASTAVLTPPYFIGENVSIGEFCQIGPEVYLGDDTSIGSRASLRSAVVLQQAHIENDQIVENELRYKG